MKLLESYPGSKGGSGVAERIIRQMPPHRWYVEGFAGGAAVFRRKAPAENSILIDEDPLVCAALRVSIAGRVGVEVICDSFLNAFTNLRWCVVPSTLVYLDPPYLRSVRTRLLYDCEYSTPDEHARLIELAISLPCMVMISGYHSPLYKKLLAKWRTVEIPTMSRGGPRIEVLWCNFPAPELLHDPRFAGGDYRERENLKRKKRRWVKKFAKMDRPERQAVAAALADCDRAAVEAALLAGSGEIGVAGSKTPLSKST